MTTLRLRLAEAQVALMFLTRLPAGPLPDDVPDLRAARWAFVPVGALIGCIAWAVHSFALASDVPSFVAAGLTLAALVILTGGLHFDGLADFADGMGGGKDAAHCLEIMRDSRIGSYGVLALILSLFIWWAALGALGNQVLLWHFVVAGCMSRGAIIGLQEGLRPAREDGLSAAASGKSIPAIAGVLVVAFLTLLTLGSIGFAILIAALVAAVWIGRTAYRRIGGQTGDVLGAAQVVSEVSIWVVLAAAL